MLIIKKIANLFFYIILIFLIFLPFWFKKKFGVVYFDQFIFHLELFVKGNLVGDAQVQKSLYKWSVASSLLGTLIYFIIKKFFLYKFNITKIKEFILFTIIILLSLTYNTGFFKIISFNQNDFIGDNYIFEEPKLIKKVERNLVLIYVESLDSFFSNKQKFGEDLLKPINEITKNEISIENFYQIPGYAFTIHSLISTQCGIPAKPIGFFKGSDLKNIKNFLPNIKCLSDFTNDLNYKNIFITSDEIENFGVKYFLRNHNYLEGNIYDVKKLSKLGYETSTNAWRGFKNKYGGMHDDVLFKASIDLIKNNLNNKKPFFLTIYTLDTHSPKGYPNHDCLLSKFNDKEITKNFNIKHAVICSVDSLKNFILNLNNLSDNIDVVILGDHSFPDNKKMDTSIYNKFILGENKKLNRDTMNHFDLYPTLLNLFGFKFENNQLGLGFNIFDEIDLELYENHIFDLDKKLSGKSEKYLSFWE